MLTLYLDFGQAKRKVDISKMMPAQWDLPNELFEIHMPKSENRTVNFCDTMVRKVNILRDKFQGNSQPSYAKKGAAFDLPSILITEEDEDRQTPRSPIFGKKSKSVNKKN